MVDCLKCGSKKVRSGRKFCSRDCGYSFKKNETGISKETLVDLYVEQQLDIYDISYKVSMSVPSIYRYLKKYSIETRGNYTDLSNKKIGNILCISPVFPLVGAGKQVKWNCKCDCGVEFITFASCIIHRKNPMCEKCVRALTRDTQELKHIIWIQIVKSAQSRNIALEIDKDYVYALFLLQDRICAISGVDIHFADTCKSHRLGGTTASLDRINSSIGYVEGNVQWVHKTINIMKLNHSQEDFLHWCELVINNRNSKNVRSAEISN